MICRNSPSLRRLLGLVSAAALLSPQVGEAKSCDKPSTDEAPVVQLRLGEWRSDLPPGISLIKKGGGFVNNGFPAMSADGNRVAMLYHGAYPFVHGYPTLDIYSTASLALQKRIEFGPRPVSISDPAPNTPDAWAEIERQLIEVNRVLAQGDFRRIPKLFDFIQQKFYAPIEQDGKRIEYVRKDGISVLIITSLATKEIELELPMPTISVYAEAEIPENNCSVRGNIRQGWYDPETQVVVLRMFLGSGRDGCELPERWLLKRL